MSVGFMYGNIYDEEERFERQAVFPKLLAKHAEDFSWVWQLTLVQIMMCDDFKAPPVVSFLRIRPHSIVMLSRQVLGGGQFLQSRRKRCIVQPSDH